MMGEEDVRSPSLAFEAAVRSALDLYMYEDAIFLAERLVAETNTDETRLLLGTCYYRSGQKLRAENILANNVLPMAKYLHIRCLIETNSKSTLTRTKLKSLLESPLSPELKCAVHCLFGGYSQNRYSHTAHSHYMKAISSNPYCITAFRAASKAGVGLKNVAQIFNEASPPPFLDTLVTTTTQLSTSIIHHQQNNMESYETPVLAIKSAYPSAFNESLYSQSPAHRVCALSTPSPIFTASPPRSRVRYQTRSKKLNPVPLAFSPMESVAHTPSTLSSSSTVATPVAPKRTAAKRKDEEKTPSTRSIKGISRKIVTRSSKKKKLPTPDTSSSSASTMTPSTPAHKLTSTPTSKSHPAFKARTFTTAKQGTALGKEEEETTSEQAAGVAEFSFKQSHAAAMRLLALFGEAIQQLERNESNAAIDAFQLLPSNHFHTCWVQSQIGRAFFQMSDYEASNKAFCSSRRLDKYVVEEMDIFSTVLWLMQSENALSYLAHELLRLDMASPITWCVLGNCCSLQKDHDRAIKYFERAIQMDPSRPYSYTLLGHECFHGDNFQRANACFLNALKLYPNHYNAVYGLGELRFKQEEIAEALAYMKRAVLINKHSPVLLCEVCKVHLARGEVLEAQKFAKKASELDPDLPIVMQKMALTHKAMGEYENALEWAKKLSGTVPKEAGPHFLLSKIYEKLGDHVNAAIAFETGTKMDPQNASNETRENQSVPGSPTNEWEDGSGDELERQRSRMD
eukprot:m.20663 g.20663  ORF g.20663 m.20663 type:complete len:741 (-) comp5273_c0_seq1:3542-5764(-)